MSFLPAPLSGPSISCCQCSSPVQGDPGMVVLNDLYFHAACVPQCQLCGQSLRSELEAHWSYEAVVVSTANGYDRLPFHHVCADCRDACLLDFEPSAQD